MAIDEETLLAKQLNALAVSRCPVEVYRDRLRSRDPLVGRVLAHSKWVLMLEKVDANYQHDGFVAVRISDLTRLRSGGRELEMAARIVRFRDDPLVVPELALLELSSAISFFNKVFGHVSLFIEEIDTDVCFIGNELDVDDDFVLLMQYGSMRSMDRSEMLLRYGDITRVEAGGTYERQLLNLFSSIS